MIGALITNLNIRNKIIFYMLMINLSDRISFNVCTIHFKFYPKNYINKKFEYSKKQRIRVIFN